MDFVVGRQLIFKGATPGRLALLGLVHLEGPWRGDWQTDKHSAATTLAAKAGVYMKKCHDPHPVATFSHKVDDPDTKTFIDASKSVNMLLEDKKLNNSADNAMERYLGESEWS
ncbi:hypothetical protein [Pseudomonas wadenswilerensis]|uniref:hypothetical protein n=1 Tax=Pseudomonas wadenswilerensis TaxID=1785161 RepID=UPI00215ED217|nr:hypothetical protein [Pseudomonas wadenswilerensis]UVM23830.1 hypothetical protein LOY45_09830 [Pseudomonas wadenswilerensis]